MPRESNRRVERLNELLRIELSELVRSELRDPRLGDMVTITRVETSADMSTARVYVSVFADAERQQEALKALKSAAGYLRKLLFPLLQLRRIPHLLFIFDPSLQEGDRILQLIRATKTELNASVGQPAANDESERELP